VVNFGVHQDPTNGHANRSLEGGQGSVSASEDMETRFLHGRADGLDLRRLGSSTGPVCMTAACLATPKGAAL